MLGRRRALDVLRHRRVLTAVALEAAAELPDQQTELEEAVLADERKRAVHAALARLPEEMRVAVHLVYFEDMTYDEAARVMRKNRKQVDNLLYRAKRELRIILGEDGEQLL
jgi:RNA polymerase sigma-70 factor (ECF subfamily)